MIMSRTASGVLLGALTAGCLALAWYVAPYFDGGAPGHGSSGKMVIEVAPAQPSSGANDLAQAPLRLASLQSFSATVERPIFAPDRRAPRPAAVVAPGPDLTFDLSLKGIIVSPETRLAVVSAGLGGKPMWLAVGDEYRGWRLAEITAKEVAFHLGGAVKRLALVYDGETSTAPAPVIGARTQSYLRPLQARPKVVAGGDVPGPGTLPTANGAAN